MTLRESLSASDNAWSAVLFDARRGAFHQSQRYAVRLVDRIGGGDSFAAGLIFELVSGARRRRALRLRRGGQRAQADAFPGDFNQVSVDEVERLVAGDASGRVQR